MKPVLTESRLIIHLWKKLHVPIVTTVQANAKVHFTQYIFQCNNSRGPLEERVVWEREGDISLEAM